MNLTKYETILEKWGDRADDAKDAHKQALFAVNQLGNQLTTAQTEYKNILQAQQIAKEVAQSIQKYVHSRLQTIVTKALAAVFDEPYTFKIEFVQRRGKTEADIQFWKNGEIYDPGESMGFGVLDVASFALRLAACLLRNQPDLRRIIIMDEPFKHLDAGARPRVRALMDALASELDVQIIISTHAPQLQTGHIINLGG